MSSVTRFIRQVPVSTTYYNAQGLFSAGVAVAANIYEFVPTAANYVGNYPPGTMQTASAALQAALNQAWNANSSGAGLVLRDLGKTIFAATTSGASNFGYFRQVQLIAPSSITSTQGFIGGTAGPTFGVLGAANTPDAFTDYMTFYIPVVVAGVLGPATPVNTQAFALAGGQM